MTKRWIVLCLTGILILASSLTAFAEDKEGKSDWQVTFDGNKMINNFTSSDIDRDVFSLLPGDSIELTITLMNSGSYTGQADWYISNEVLETLEIADDNTEVASGGAYDYLLTYTDTKGVTTPIYSSEKFGGEGRYDGIGLAGATASLDEYFYLERLGKGDKGTVKLKVALDGETLANDYQDTFASLQMNFAAELVQSGTTRVQTPGRNREIIKTGDQSRIMLYILLALGSGLVLLLIAFLRMRQEQEESVLEAEDGSVSGLQYADDTEQDNQSDKRQIWRRRRQ